MVLKGLPLNPLSTMKTVDGKIRNWKPLTGLILPIESLVEKIRASIYFINVNVHNYGTWFAIMWLNGTLCFKGSSRLLWISQRSSFRTKRHTTRVGVGCKNMDLIWRLLWAALLCWSHYLYIRCYQCKHYYPLWWQTSCILFIYNKQCWFSRHISKI